MYSNQSYPLHRFYATHSGYFRYIPWRCRRSVKAWNKRETQGLNRIAHFKMRRFNSKFKYCLKLGFWMIYYDFKIHHSFSCISWSFESVDSLRLIVIDGSKESVYWLQSISLKASPTIWTISFQCVLQLRLLDNSLSKSNRKWKLYIKLVFTSSI